MRNRKGKKKSLAKRKRQGKIKQKTTKTKQFKKNLTWIHACMHP
jgi:hypothetical protein